MSHPLLRPYSLLPASSGCDRTWFVARFSPQKVSCRRVYARLVFAPMRVGTELGRGGLTLLVSLSMLACSDNRTLYPKDERASDAGDGGREANGKVADSGKSDLSESVSRGEAGTDDTKSPVSDRVDLLDGGTDGGGTSTDPARPTFLPEERPLPTPDLVEPDPVDIHVGDSVPDIAVRLSRFIWRTEPDATTVDLARKGELDTAQGVYDEAQRLLEDPRARQGFLSFFGAWSELTGATEAGLTHHDGDAGVAPPDGGARVAFDVAARAELDAYFMGLVTSGAGLRDLVQQSFEVAEPTLIDLFAGESAIERAGVFSQPFVLAAGSLPERPSPSRRGAFIARRLLCEDFAAPDHPEVNLLPAASTVRDWLTAETKAQDCARCHSAIDSLGFALDGFDQWGRGRVTENGESIDTNVELSVLGLPAADGPRSLGISLLYHRNTLPCVLSHWFKYALRREPRDEDNASWVELVRGSEFYELSEIPALIAATQSFRAE
jgi:Protein of unknown function (DUF1588)/Protein of unknown function (DUF1592)